MCGGGSWSSLIKPASYCRWRSLFIACKMENMFQVCSFTNLCTYRLLHSLTSIRNICLCWPVHSWKSSMSALHFNLPLSKPYASKHSIMSISNCPHLSYAWWFMRQEVKSVNGVLIKGEAAMMLIAVEKCSKEKKNLIRKNAADSTTHNLLACTDCDVTKC